MSNSNPFFTPEDENIGPQHYENSVFPHTVMLNNSLKDLDLRLGNMGDSEDALPHCSHGALLGPLGLFVQALLAFIAFGSLIVKRFCEPKRERRPWIIWFFDTSKQAIGAAVIHFANVFLADMFTGDPCTWYIVSFLLDSTVGLIVIYLGLKITQCIGQRKGYSALTLGEYGNPPQCNIWAVQCGIYILVILVEKLLMTLLVLFDFWRDVRKLIMSPIKNPDAELILVMFVVPFIVNAFIFWVVDNFLKKKLISSNGASAITNDESAMRYFKAAAKVKYYDNSVGANRDEEADVLLNLDDDPYPGLPSSSNNSADTSPTMSGQYQLLPNVTVT